MHRLSMWLKEMRASYWFIPGLMSVAAAALATALVFVDLQLGSEFPRWLAWIATNQPDGARALLSAVAGSSITVAGVVFSVIMVVLSLTSQQFGPRLLENFMRDSGTQVVFGTLLATFLYCLLVLRVLQGGESAFVPHVALLMALALALASIAALVYLIHHVSRSIQIGNIVARAAHGTDAFVAAWRGSDRPMRSAGRSPAEALGSGSGEEGGWLLRAERSGYVSVLGRTRAELTDLARRHGVRLELLQMPGAFVPSGAPLLRLRHDDPNGGPDDATLRRRLRKLVRLRIQRSQSDDIRLGLDQIVQVALRALSPALSDPYTAETCLEHVTDDLRKIALAGGPPDAYCDREGEVRWVEPRLTMADLVRDALGPIRRMAADDLRVALKLFDSIAQLRGLPLDRDGLDALRSEADLHGEAAWRRAVAPPPEAAPPRSAPDVEERA